MDGFWLGWNGKFDTSLGVRYILRGWGTLGVPIQNSARERLKKSPGKQVTQCQICRKYPKIKIGNWRTNMEKVKCFWRHLHQACFEDPPLAKHIPLGGPQALTCWAYPSQLTEKPGASAPHSTQKSLEFIKLFTVPKWRPEMLDLSSLISTKSPTRIFLAENLNLSPMNKAHCFVFGTWETWKYPNGDKFWELPDPRIHFNQLLANVQAPGCQMPL